MLNGEYSTVCKGYLTDTRGSMINECSSGIHGRAPQSIAISPNPCCRSERAHEIPKLDSYGLCLAAKSVLLGIALTLAAPVQATPDLFKYSLEELLSLEITSAAKKSQAVFEATTAIFVITQEDIRHSGMTSIPELLRMVPGLQVARIDANKWAISSRGFNGRWANKLLVLIDGISAYSSMFSGVYWDIQDMPLEDIERIEIIRGPGGTLWGANAVNGVINVISKNTQDTQGFLATVKEGNQERGVNLRYGGTFGRNAHFRIYAKTDDVDNFVDTFGDDANDGWDQQRVGFRTDWSTGPESAMTMQGSAYTGDARQKTINFESLQSMPAFVDDHIEQRGSNLLFRWQRKLNEGSRLEFQTYYEHTERSDITNGQVINTFDLDFQHSFQATPRQEITWGLDYRGISDRMRNSFTVSFDPEMRRTNLYGAFIQDEISLRKKLKLTLGSKFEHNDYTGFEYMPNIRLLWLASEHHTWWSALSRAVRMPSRTDSDIRINVTAFSSPYFDPDGPGPLPAGTPTLMSILGNKKIEAEEVKVIEMGYRGQLRPDMLLDLAVFYNFYDDLNSKRTELLQEATPPPDHVLMASTFHNQMKGESYGLELALSAQITKAWRLNAGYAYQKLNMKLDPGSNDIDSVTRAETSTPEQQFQLRSHWDIHNQLSLDCALYVVDDIKVPSVNGHTAIPAYKRLDIRLAWRPRENLEISIAGQNLLNDQHLEYVTEDIFPTQVPRTVYGRITYRFQK